jgi:hypothetical protein
MKAVAKFLLNALVAWLAGCLFITATLYFSNAGADFTITDIMGFSVLSIIASGILMLVVYTPSLYWLKRRQGGIVPRHRFPLLAGVVCNIPVFIMFALLIDRKMPATEAFGFMLTFLVIGVSFGYGFTVSRVQS